MRYRVVVSRVQTAERHVRAPSEDDAIKKVQAELDRHYGFLGGWTTIDADMDVIGIESAVGYAGSQVTAEGQLLLSIKDAAKQLGISYAKLNELVNAGEINHVAIGSRRYISRQHLQEFIDAHTQQGYVPRG